MQPRLRGCFTSWFALFCAFVFLGTICLGAFCACELVVAFCSSFADGSSVPARASVRDPAALIAMGAGSLGG